MMIPLYLGIAVVSSIFLFGSFTWAKSCNNATIKQRVHGVPIQTLNQKFSLLKRIKLVIDHVGHRTREIHKEEATLPNILLAFAVMMIQRALIARRMSDCKVDRFLTERLTESDSGMEPVEKKTLESLLEHVKYAEWAYPFDKNYKNIKECLRQEGYELLIHKKAADIGNVAHYVAINRREKILLIVPRGSWSLADILTDAAGLPVEQKLEQAEEPRLRQIWSHEGVMTAANALAEEYTDLIDKTAVLSAEGYKLHIVGHSLGGAVACIMGIIMLSKFPSLKEPGRLHVWAYAPPPCLNDEASRAFAPYISTIVWNTDFVPTLSVGNYVQTMQMAAHMMAREKENYKSFITQQALIQGAATLLGWKYIPEEKLDSMVEDAIGKAKSLKTERLASDAPDVFVPGRVVYLWERRHQDEPTGEINGVTTRGRTFLPLSFVVPSATSFANHFLPSYERGMRQLLEQLGDNHEHRVSIYLRRGQTV